MKLWFTRAAEAPPAPMDAAAAARELGRLGGQVIGARRHAEAEARDHAEHERVKAVARRLRADCHLPPKLILEPKEFADE